MTTKENATLLMCCGALNDMAENSYGTTRIHLKTIQAALEAIGIKYLRHPETIVGVILHKTNLGGVIND